MKYRVLKKHFMKYFLFAFNFIIAGYSGFAQVQARPALSASADQLSRTTVLFGNTAQDLVYDRTKIYLDYQTYIVDGAKVTGSPFLYPVWNGGTVTTTDGKIFSNYKLKYNAFNQTVFFSDGKDSLEANEPVKEFYLMVPEEKGVVKKYTFIHSDQVKKEKQPFYYEVLIDSSRGQLLKLNRKIVREGSNSLPGFAGKVFYLELTYFFYDKQTKKITRLKGNGTNISETLRLTKAEEEAMELNNLDFNKEEDIVGLFNAYFKKKAF